MGQMDQTDAAVRYLPLLVQGDGAGILSLFEGEPSIDDPREGRSTGQEEVLRFVESAHGWLSEHDAQVEPFALTQSQGRSVAEQVLRLIVGGKRVGLPVAVVGELTPSGGLRALRVYHSMWPLLGSHRVRKPLLEAAHDLKLPEVVERYQWALATGELETMLTLFEADGYAREPSGGDYVYRGPDRLREFYSSLFSVGGIPLEHCTLSDDGTRSAIEYNVVMWGTSKLTPQAGVAVYERGPSGLLAAARIYDDVAVEEGAEGAS